MDELFRYFQINYEKGGEGGSGGSGGDSGGGDSQEAAVSENNADIGELSRKIAGGEDGESGEDPRSRHIGYFEEDIGEGGEGEEPDPQPTGEEGGDDFEGDDDFEDLSDDLEDDAGEPAEGGDEGPKAPEGKEDYFYVPERDAEGRDPYPNEFETRMDAQFAISEKVDTYDKYSQQLEEAESQIGAAIDPELKEKIEKYKDLDYANQVDDDTLRADIVDMDEGLKAVKMKVDRVQTQREKQQSKKEAEKQYTKAEKQARQSSQEIGLPERLNELPEGADKNDLLELVDDQISKQLSEVDQKIQDFQNNDKYLKENGQQAYSQRLVELMDERREVEQQMREHKSNIEDWWDAQQEYRAAKEQTTKMTDAERAKAVDEAFIEFQEDRSQGPNALDIFTKSKDTKPIVHFRQYALSPANRDKFDLTSPEGWVKAHADWRRWVNENVQAKKNGKKKQEAKKKKRKPIPSPSPNRQRQGIVSPTADFDGAQKNAQEIGKLAREIMGG